MKKILIGVVVVITLGLLILPFFLPTTTNQSIGIGTNLISALASFATLLIAILLYSKYGAEKSLLQKQTDVVFRLLHQLKKTRFFLEDEEHFLQLFLERLNYPNWEEYKNRELLFDYTYAEGLNEIWETAEDVFLPTQIAQKMESLKMLMLICVPIEAKHLKVLLPGYQQTAKDDQFGLLNNKSLKFHEFISLWKGVIDETKKWLEIHSDIAVNLNFYKN